MRIFPAVFACLASAGYTDRVKRVQRLHARQRGPLSHDEGRALTRSGNHPGSEQPWKAIAAAFLAANPSLAFKLGAPGRPFALSRRTALAGVALWPALAWAADSPALQLEAAIDSPLPAEKQTAAMKALGLPTEDQFQAAFNGTKELKVVEWPSFILVEPLGEFDDELRSLEEALANETNWKPIKKRMDKYFDGGRRSERDFYLLVAGSFVDFIKYDNQTSKELILADKYARQQANETNWPSIKRRMDQYFSGGLGGVLSEKNFYLGVAGSFSDKIQYDEKTSKELVFADRFSRQKDMEEMTEALEKLRTEISDPVSSKRLLIKFTQKARAALARWFSRCPPSILENARTLTTNVRKADVNKDGVITKDERETLGEPFSSQWDERQKMFR